MSSEGTIERLTAVRTGVERVCGWLMSPAPETLDRCSSVLSEAAATLSDGAGGLGEAKGDAAAMAEVWGLERALRRARRLLGAANDYYAGWNRIRAAMIDGYEPGGRLAAPVAPGRIRVEA